MTPPATIAEIVLEQPAPCADAAAAEWGLRLFLAEAPVPHAGWTLHMRAVREGRALRANAYIVDEAGETVAERSVSDRSMQCAPLARAIGVWALLVFDQAMREHPESAPAPAPAAPPAPTPPRAPAEGRDAGAREDKRRGITFDLGASTFAMAGAGTRVLAGPALFADVGDGVRWFARPGIALGRSVESARWTEWWSVIVADGCGRVVGANRWQEPEWQIDLCGGAEIGGHGFTADVESSGLRPSFNVFIALGPSFAVRRTFTSGVAFELRTIGRLNFGGLMPGQDDQGPMHETPLVARIELGASFRLDPGLSSRGAGATEAERARE